MRCLAVAAAAAIIIAKRVSAVAAAEQKDYKDYNPETTVVSEIITTHCFAPPILCSLYHTQPMSFGDGI